MKLTGLQYSLYRAIRAGSPAGKIVVVHKARHPLRLARLLERKGFVKVTRLNGDSYFAQLTGKDPDACDMPKNLEFFKGAPVRNTIFRGTRQFPAKVADEYPGALRVRRYMDPESGAVRKTVEIEIDREKEFGEFSKEKSGHKCKKCDKELTHGECLFGGDLCPSCHPGTPCR